MYVILIAASSIIIQFGTALLALRLISITGRRSAWVLISTGFFIMALRRSLSFAHMISSYSLISFQASAEWLAFITSLLMLLGIIRIKPLFQSIRRSSEALRESEKKYRTVFESCKDAIYLSTRDGRFIDVNKSALELFGYTREEMIGMDVLKVYAVPEARSKFQEEIEKLESVKDYPLVLIRKDGTTMECLISAATLLNEEGLPTGYQGVIRDVSEHNRLINLLAAERQRFFSLLDELPAFVDLRTPDHTIVFANKCFRETFGDPDERPCHLVLHESSAPCTPCHSAAVFESDKPLEFEWTRTNGRTYRVHQYCHTDATGSKLMLELGMDITELKRAEEQRTQLVAAIEQAAEGIVIIDKEEKILYANPAFERISSSHMPGILGQSLYGLERDYHDLSFRNGIRGCLHTGQIWYGHLAGRSGAMGSFEVEASISPVRSVDGSIINCVVIERDVTNEARLEKQLIQAQKMEALGTLAGGIAHDFNNILSIVIGYADLALLESTDVHKMKRYMQDVRKAACRAKELVDQILAFSRQGEHERRPISIGTVAEETLKLLRASLPSSIEIQQRIVSESMVLADSTQMRQVIMNLCANAGHAMREHGGTLEVSVTDVELDQEFVVRHPAVFPGPYVRLSVCDTGHGMDPATLERVFDPYFTTKGPGEGTGLGLAVVHGIVEGHGGMVTVYSEPGVGTSFHVYLPKFQNSDLPLNVPIHGSSSRVLGGNESILFVDDELGIVDVSLNQLQALGYRVTTRTSSLEALEAFRAHPDRFDLVITDLTMPQMGGLELARELRQIKPDVPIILCSGFSGMLTPDGLKAAGISSLMPKPVILDDLARAIREILDQKKCAESNMQSDQA